jgi:hypothetical protein
VEILLPAAKASAFHFGLVSATARAGIGSKIVFFVSQGFCILAVITVLITNTWIRFVTTSSLTQALHQFCYSNCISYGFFIHSVLFLGKRNITISVHLVSVYS